MKRSYLKYLPRRPVICVVIEPDDRFEYCDLSWKGK